MFGKYKQGISVIILITVFILVVAIPLTNIIKLILMAAALVVIALNSRGNAYYAKANKIINSKNMARMNEAVVLYMKAVKAGISTNYQLMAGTIILQYGDIEEGKKILSRLTNDGNKDIRCVSKLSLSMYYWIKKDLNKAIDLCVETKDEGYRNHNLYVNLATYYLCSDNQKQFQKIVKEASSNNMLSVPLIDLQAAYYMLQGNWNTAGGLLTKLFKQVTPSFPDPYVHMAQIKLHYGNVKDAIEYLKSGLDSIFSNTVLFQKKELEDMLRGLENEDTRLAWAEGINSSTRILINGKLPEIEPISKKCSTLLLPGYPAEPDFKLQKDTPSIMARNVNEDDERDVDTDLNEQDEIWLKKHS